MALSHMTRRDAPVRRDATTVDGTAYADGARPVGHRRAYCRYNDSALFADVRAPRTPNWNISCADHHWLIRQQPPMTDEQAARSDALYRERWYGA